MRCRANELAMIVKCQDRFFDDSIGMVFELGEASNTQGFWEWTYKGPRRIYKGVTIKLLNDKCLRPIRDQDGTDESLTWGAKKETHEQQKQAGLEALRHFGVKL